MFRLLGIIIGSVISIGGILLVLGIPQFDFSSFESDQARFDAAVQKLREKQASIDEPANAAATGAKKTVAEPPSTPGGSTTEAEDVRTPAVADAAEEAASLPVATDDWQSIESAEPDALGTTSADTLPTELQWQDFWNPFRSEIAARGFVSQLERVTGLDYRIVKVKAGEYQVGFAYHSDDERRSHIQQIADATGLDLPEM